MKEINDSKRAYSTRWDKVADDLRRYEIILEDNSSGYYYANGIPVMARKSIKEAGYVHNDQ